MKQIKFKTFGANTHFGAFEPGQTMRVGDELAAHLVEAGVAVVVGAVPANEEVVVKQTAAKTAKKK